MAKKTKEEKAIIKAEREAIKEAAHEQHLLDRALVEIRKDVKLGKIPTDPTWIHKVGDRVKFGGHDKTEIVEILDNALIYKIRNFGSKKIYGTPTDYEQFNYIPWIEARKMPKQTDKTFRSTDDLVINFSNQSLDSLLHKIYYSGIDFNPEYQRDLVWDKEDKVALIDSIFNNIEIGKFAFIQRDYSHDIFYEVLDGKQRLTAIREFYENRFTYKGLTFDELSYRDQHHFTNFPIVSGQTLEPKDRKAIYRYFIKLNTSGKTIDTQHLNKIKNLAK